MGVINIYLVYNKKKKLHSTCALYIYNLGYFNLDVTFGRDVHNCWGYMLNFREANIAFKHRYPTKCLLFLLFAQIKWEKARIKT